MTGLKPHQLKAIRELRNGSILRADPGTGKTRIALVYFYTHIAGGMVRVNGVGGWKPPTTPTDLYVITTAKKRDDLDWEEEAAKVGLTTDAQTRDAIGISMRVDSWNNISQYENVKDAFFVFDEQRLVGAGAWVKAFYKIAKNNQWIILSATPGDVWMDYVPVFVANGFYKNKTAFTQEHVVWKRYRSFPVVDRYVGTKKLERLRDGLLVEVPYIKHTVPHVHHVTVAYDEALYDQVTKKRWDVFNDKPLKDVSQMFVAMRRVVNNDVSRLGEVMKLYEKHPRLIVFYNFDYELATLRTLGNLGITVAEWNGHKHEPVPETDKWIYLVQYTAGSEAWNCITTDATVFWSLNYSYKINEQSKGRIDRLNTPYIDLYYYLLVSRAPIDASILKALSSKKNFNERSEAQNLVSTPISVKNP